MLLRNVVKNQRRHMSQRLVLIGGIALQLLAAEARAAHLEPFLSGLSNPVFITHSGDGSGRLFIVEQAGVIKVLAAVGTTPTVFLTITDRVLDGGERGLLGLAFHPRYVENGRFFVNYTREPDGATVIAEYRRSSSPAVALRTESIVLTIAQPFANHNGGMIAFGPDGLLYIGMGDGGSANDPGNRAQNINDLLGKLLRIDVDGVAPYESPSDNPFAGSIPGRGEIYATGLRNPFRFSFDRANGKLYVGDVGQGKWEEISLVTNGANLGWRVFEGNHCTNLDPLCTSGEFTPPIAEYAHSGGRCSVTGGYVYRGALGTVPAGTYVFGDFCTGELLTLSGSSVGVMLDSTLNISSFGEDEAGELYVVGLGGTVHRLVGNAVQHYGLTLGELPDFNGLGTTDILWRHSTPGTYAIWFMNGGAPSDYLVFGVDTSWRAAGTGDLNGDGTSDLLWRSAATGALGVWFMNGGTVLRTAVLGVGPGWDFVGTGDVNADGKDDLLWRSTTTGALGVWLMNGSSVIRTAVLPIGREWSLAATGDVNGDGKADLLWRNSAVGRLVIWLMNGVSVLRKPVFNVGAEWDVTGIGDVNGDGTRDVLWREAGTETLAIWFMAGGDVAGAGVFGVGTGWRVVGVGDLNGDTTADILWRKEGTGLLAMWFMDGGTVLSAISFDAGAGWEPIPQG
jgi:glucose/arabinose dehydrogenase